MSKRRIALVVGNGLGIDLYKHSEYSGLPICDGWNPCAPFRFPLLNYAGYLPTFPGLRQVCEAPDLPTEERGIRQINQMIKEAERAMPSAVDDIARERALSSLFHLTDNLRHYLAHAYSQYQLVCVEKWLTLCEDWQWLRWIGEHAREIAYVVSFNYDLVVERLLDLNNARYRRIGIMEEKRGIPILKPHGSIDFVNDMVEPGSPAYAGLRFVDLDTPMRAMNGEEMLGPRPDAAIVLPTEYSRIMDYQWVGPGYDRFHEWGRTYTDLIMVGLSYWECDRPEIDFLLGSLAPTTRVHVVDPVKNDDLQGTIDQLGLRYIPCGAKPPSF